MQEGWFSEPVPVSECITGDIHYVSSARQALNMLNGRWRERGSDKHRAALRACQHAIHGDEPAEAARSAFVAAAMEARVLSHII